MLSTRLSVGPTHLRVRSLSLMLAYYRDLVGLSLISQSEEIVVLGTGNVPVIVLEQDLVLSWPRERSAGLYHQAILFSSQSQLADSLTRIMTHKPELYQGSADHLVSEAFYFADPEGNGVELYYDQDPGFWQWQDGKIVMASLPLDINTYIRRYRNTRGRAGVRPGHVHLKVGSIAMAREFYVNTMGMIVTAELPGALFVSDGVYHHTLGLNTWESEGAGPRDMTLGLSLVELKVAKRTDLLRLAERLDQSRIEYKFENEKLNVYDPWGNELELKVEKID